MQVFTVGHGDVVRSLTAQLEAAGIRNGAIVSLIGAVDEFTISNMPARAPSDELVNHYPLSGELHGGGEVVDGVLRLNVTVSTESDRPFGGRLHSAEVATHAVRAYVIPLP